MSSNKSLIPQYLLIVFLISGLSYWLFTALKIAWPFTIDDMYISLRYAKNMANGDGLVWNIGQAPVEGYSNFSFVIIGFLALKWGLDPVLILKLMGIIGLIASVLLLYCLARLWVGRLRAIIPVIWLVSYCGEILWAVSGLETTVFQALISASLLLVLKGSGYNCSPNVRGPTKTSYFICAGFVLALASLTRPEGPLLALLFFIISFYDTPRKERKPLYIGSITFVLFYTPYFIWRYGYYGALFPNPVYCKGFVDQFLVLDNVYLSLMCPFFLLTAVTIYSSRNRLHYYFWTPSLLYLILLSKADPIVAFLNRLFLPIFPFILPVSLVGIIWIADYCAVDKRKIFIVFISVLVFFWIPRYSFSNLASFTLNPIAGERLRNQVIDWLEHNMHPTSTVVLGDSGMIPFKSPLNFLDSTCLNNKDIPTYFANDYKKFSQHTLSLKPHLIIITSLLTKDNLQYMPGDKSLFDEIHKNSDYQRTAVFCSKKINSSYCYTLYTIDE